VVARLVLSVPSPNPFATSTRIGFALPREAEVRLDVLDVGGRLVRELLAGERRAPGNYSVEWDGTTQRGGRAASGMYFVRLRAGSEQLTRRVVAVAR
jgi:flagellar hook assembly protein FlgD